MTPPKCLCARVKGKAGETKLSHLSVFCGGTPSTAKAQAEYHADRVTFWKKEQEEAVAKAKAAGVEFREYEVTGGKSFDVVVDPTLLDRLSVCSTKIINHQKAQDRFQIEAAAYGTQTGRTYEVDPDDVVYFRLAGGPREL